MDPHHTVGLPIPKDGPVDVRGIERNRDVPPGPIDTRLDHVVPGPGECFQRARCGLIADHRRGPDAAHPDEEDVIRALVEPARIGFGEERPPIPRYLGHRPHIEPTNPARRGRIGVIGCGRIAGEREG